MKWLLTVAALSLVAPASAKKPDFARPTYAGAYEPQGVDERGLWMELDNEERALRDAPYVLHDPALESFVRTVLCHTIGDERCKAVRVYLVKDGSFNASMAPNGLLIVNTGLLSRLHSEAELAMVLGHEFAHFEQRHTLYNFRRLRGATDAMSWISLLGAASGTNVSATLNGIIFAHIAFSRSQESEADLLSASFIKASPYRLHASEIWRRAQEEDDALRVERGLRTKRHMTPGLLDDHPTDLQRFATFSKLEADAGAEGEEGLDAYRDATRPDLDLLFAALVKSNDFAAADYVIRSRGDAMGWDASLLTLRGDLYRARGNPRDLTTSRDLFQQAIAQPDAPPSAWRGLGLSAYRAGDTAAGRAALTEYLKRAPAAADAALIKPLAEGQ